MLKFGICLVRCSCTVILSMKCGIRTVPMKFAEFVFGMVLCSMLSRVRREHACEQSEGDLNDKDRETFLGLELGAREWARRSGMDNPGRRRGSW